MESDTWYKAADGIHPYSLIAEASSLNQDTQSFCAVACFPWTSSSLEDLWRGDLNLPETVDPWRRTFEKWRSVVAVGGGPKVLLMLIAHSPLIVPLFNINIPDAEANVKTIAWCMAAKAAEFLPLLAFSGNGILYIFNLESGEFHGVLRGHGGHITSLAVHPTYPYLLCSTSYDHTVRIYDLTVAVNGEFKSQSWPGGVPCLGGPAFGLRSNESEGDGHGRCVAILVGGPSGGHQACVLGAAFHPTYPLIATCGVDNCIKIWRTPPLRHDSLWREDKPLFSSSRIHSAQVLSVSWMSQDILLSHCGPVIFRHPSHKKLDKAPGTMVLWRWLGLDRFFPPDQERWPEIFRGCASDYQESSSFKIISSAKLPQPIKAVRIYVHRDEPLVLIPVQGGIKATSPIHMKPRASPPFPDPDDELSEAAKRLAIDDGRSSSNLTYWEIFTNNDQTVGSHRLEACALGEDGDLLVGVGKSEGIWIWRALAGKST
ncbi:WD40 repeat-like protein [Rickenella mellea]|uniref:WD40 repeat-like protein n=1 Tax=Rickenella mellea TaxID=50990 RepID=A0A4Y7QMQ6_9AGAM|nr:WD40 repeat-like protein [Rickenella mellea]